MTLTALTNTNMVPFGPWAPWFLGFSWFVPAVLHRCTPLHQPLLTGVCRGEFVDGATHALTCTSTTYPSEASRGPIELWNLLLHGISY
jgi:hypothetical protein